MTPTTTREALGATLSTTSSSTSEGFNDNEGMESLSLWANDREVVPAKQGRCAESGYDSYI